MSERAKIHVTGIVQGVGFRPFVYRVAIKLSLVGTVLNMGDAGVRIVVEGKREAILSLVNEIQNNPPSISRIDSLDIKWLPPKNDFIDFGIEKSTSSRGADAITIIPPDIAICDYCVEELTNPESRWFRYPFTSCAACGPRFSTITDLPYDRPYTTMVDFPLCNICNTGYTNPLDRRYHAQTTACGDCGPIYSLYDIHGERVNEQNPVKAAANLIDESAVVVLQGIAGTHIVTKVSTDEAIEKLRTRKNRFQRPFAIMVRNLDTLQDFAALRSIDVELLTSWRRPIILVYKKAENRTSLIPEDVLDKISPGLDTIGVMLPYAPLHHLLFQYSREPAFVVTSANPIAIPMYIEPHRILSELKDIAGYYLVHNRVIHQRADDSVIKVLLDNNPVFIRRSRGYVPEPIELNGRWKGFSVIAVGPEEKATGAILKSQRVYMTQYIGDTNRIENIEFLGNSIDHMLYLLGVERINAVGADLHPEFLSTELASQYSSEKNVPLIQVQHHHAHLASLIADANIDCDTSIVCITADGYGFGSDKKAWGGEILLGGLSDFVRKGGLDIRYYPGGDLTAKYAVRPLIGLLADALDSTEILEITEGVHISPNTVISEESLFLLLEMIEKRVNVLESTSSGRFLDAVSLLLGVCSENSYDGECPMKLEAVSIETDLRIEPKFVSSDYGTCLDLVDLMQEILQLKRQSIRRGELAYAAQWYLGDGLARIACQVAQDNAVEYVGFSGGVALNTVITKAVVECVRNEGLTPLLHKVVPPGDGGISVGQVAVVAQTLLNEYR